MQILRLLYTTTERGWLALAFLVLVLFLQGLFGYPAYRYRELNGREAMLLNCYGKSTGELNAAREKAPGDDRLTCNVLDLQLAFTPDRLICRWRFLAVVLVHLYSRVAP